LVKNYIPKTDVIRDWTFEKLASKLVFPRRMRKTLSNPPLGK